MEQYTQWKEVELGSDGCERCNEWGSILILSRAGRVVCNNLEIAEALPPDTPSFWFRPTTECPRWRTVYFLYWTS